MKIITDKAWAAIRRELARVDVDADLAKTEISAMFDVNGAMSLRDGLEALAHKFADSAPVGHEDDFKDIRKADQALKRLQNRMGKRSSNYAADLNSRIKKFRRYLQAAEKGMHKKWKPTNSLLHLLVFLYFEISCRDPAIGAATSPLVCFLFEASSPILGSQARSREAIREYLKRDRAPLGPFNDREAWRKLRTSGRGTWQFIWSSLKSPIEARAILEHEAWARGVVEIPAK